MEGAYIMSVTMNNEYGSIEVSTDVIATVVGGAATEIPGVVGMASRQQVRDGLNEILRKENYAKGIVVKQNEGVVVDVYIIVSYGTKISEVSKNVQERVSYQLETNLSVKADAINIFVHGVRVQND